MQIHAGLLLLLAVSSAFAHPAHNPENDAEVISLPRGQQGVRKPEAADPDFNDFSGVVDTGAYPFFSRTPYNPFGTDFIDNFRSVFRRLGESLLNRWNAAGDFDTTKGNTTSVVEIIDGHKVEINDTVYTKADESGHAVYKVRVVNIRPIDSGEEAAATPGPEDDKGSPEEVEKQPENNEVLSNIDSSENTNKHSTTSSTTPIPQDLEHAADHHNFQKMENFGVETHNKDPKYEILEQNDENEWKLKHGEQQEGERKQENARERFRNGVRRVTNHLMKTIENFQSHNGRSPHHERLSMINRNPYQYATYKGQNREPLADESSEESAPEDILNFDDNTEWGVIKGEDFNKEYEIDKYGKVPVDLSNDIAVNDILADQNAPFDPRAEIIPVEQIRPNNRRPPFYYLSQHLRNKMYHPIK